MAQLFLLNHFMKHEMAIYNKLFLGMGGALFSVACWIGLSVAHLPAIEQKLDDYIVTTNNQINDLKAEINRLEARLP